MKRIASLLALAVLAGSARAEEAKAEVKKDPNHVKVEMKHKRSGHTQKTKATETVERDANGNIIRHEKKVQH